MGLKNSGQQLQLKSALDNYINHLRIVVPKVIELNGAAIYWILNYLTLK